MQKQPTLLIPGTVLLDRYIKTETEHLGGAEFNFAHHLHAFRIPLDFIARIGDDPAGKTILSYLDTIHFPTKLIQIDPQHPSKTVTVKHTSKNEPIFIIPSNVASEYLEQPPLSVDTLRAYPMAYFGTTLQYGEQSRAIVRTLLAQCKGTLFCDINLRPNKFTPETVRYALHTCTVLKLNHQELTMISDIATLEGSLQERLQSLAQQFHIEIICLTLAEKGSLLYRDQTFFQCAATPGPICDTVGAGDAFSACLALGLIQRWDSQTLLANASAFAGAICQIQGAVPNTLDFYTPWIQRFFPQR